MTNCHCEIKLTVPGDDEATKPSESVRFTDRRFGKKVGKHCRDWNLDPAVPEDRQKLKDIIIGIIDGAEDVSSGDWRGQPNPCTFYLKGDDLVITNADGEFVTVVKGGATNARYINAISANRD